MKNALFVGAIVLVMAGCSVAGVEETALDTKVVAEAQTVDTSIVSRIADGSWIYSSYVTGADHVWVDLMKVWVDIKVQNLAYQKQVGLIWTVNNWASANVSYADYEYSLGGGYEQWGIDLGPWDDRYYSTFEYAVFAEMNGETWYDNNNGQNYSIEW